LSLDSPNRKRVGGNKQTIGNRSLGKIGRFVALSTWQELGDIVYASAANDNRIQKSLRAVSINLLNQRGLASNLTHQHVESCCHKRNANTEQEQSSRISFAKSTDKTTQANREEPD